MILDRIENSDLYKHLDEKITNGLAYIKATDLNALKGGKYVINENMTVIVDEYNTRDQADCKLEAHEKFIDIQYMLDGNERMGYAPLQNQKPTIPYNTEKDVAFYEEEVSLLSFEQGTFAVFFPTDLHQPKIKFQSEEFVRKIVVKIKI